MSIIFLFVDGVGLGKPGPQNPLVRKKASYSSLDFMTQGQPFTRDVKPVEENKLFFSPVDACLNVDGLPQSGTGQTTLFSGTNASELLGRHFGPYPHSKIRPLLKEGSLFGQLKDMGKSVYFMNAFPEIFFEIAKKRNRWSCCTLMTRSANQKLNSLEEVLNGTAITADILQAGWRDYLNIDVPEISVKEAANRVVRMAELYDLILVEFYLTDKAGHSQDDEYAEKILTRFNGFVSEIIDTKSDEVSVLMTSDHGNIEDLTTKTHTRNEVPFFVAGPAASHFKKVKSILDVTPTVVNYFTGS